ncbi:hypothetical protein [Chryseolinea sp. H1M3-3]|uniref:antibiotic biosynthesis monooxygenase family protein n=1 Tax=Chryseolinea sp. H1M3-3 TaxID=3034144 RepID=UPI0023ED4FD5|nr:hypothetical protein [Chryseolinea sp. H1M3-3]
MATIGTNSKDQVSFIDKFIIPTEAKSEFYERMRINRQFIKTLPGFLGDTVYENRDHDGNLNCITIALWESMDAVNNAKELVQAEYRKQNFDPSKMMARLNIKMDRGIYGDVTDEHITE